MTRHKLSQFYCRNFLHIKPADPATAASNLGQDDRDEVLLAGQRVPDSQLRADLAEGGEAGPAREVRHAGEGEEALWT